MHGKRDATFSVRPHHVILDIEYAVSQERTATHQRTVLKGMCDGCNFRGDCLQVQEHTSYSSGDQSIAHNDIELTARTRAHSYFQCNPSDNAFGHHPLRRPPAPSWLPYIFNTSPNLHSIRHSINAYLP